MHIKVGYELVYHCPQPTPMVLMLTVHHTRSSDLVVPDRLATDPPLPVHTYHDGFGNWCSRIVAPAGRTRLIAEGVVNDSGEPDPVALDAIQHTIADLPVVALRVLALLAEQRRRLEQRVVALARLDARERICRFVLGIYDRLQRGGLVSRPTFNLPLNQDRIGDHLGMTMVHVSLTLRRLREERLLIVDRQVLIISDIEGVREVAKGARPALPTSALEGGDANHSLCGTRVRRALAADKRGDQRPPIEGLRAPRIVRIGSIDCR